MLSFQNDYQEGAHEKILKRLMETNLEPQSGYGSDSYTESAKEKIRKVCECPQADVWFLTGGTQTNQNVIDAMLQPYEGVVAASTGHVSVHEAGAIEFTGHKPFLSMKARSTLKSWRATYEDSGKTQIMNTWYFQAWSISPIPLSTEPYIPVLSWKISPPSAKLMIFHSIWMVPDWVMVS